jgi:hypothetical protein
MYSFNTLSSRYVWDIYAEIGANRYAKLGSDPGLAAERAAKFADAMCAQRAIRFPPEDKKTK